MEENENIVQEEVVEEMKVTPEMVNARYVEVCKLLGHIEAQMKFLELDKNKYFAEAVKLREQVKDAK